MAAAAAAAAAWRRLGYRFLAAPPYAAGLLVAAMAATAAEMEDVEVKLEGAAASVGLDRGGGKE